MIRKLAAILAADVAGYSRLMQSDEKGTLESLQAHRQVTDKIIADHRGRIFGSAGDSLIADFASAVDAVEAAADIQQEMARRNQVVASDKQLRFRIGLNIGDVIVEDGNVFGDGVNVASRIEAFAEPGGICLSSAVFEHVQGKVALTFELIGPHTLKNIAQPVTLFRIGLDGKPRPLLVKWLELARRRSKTLALLAITALLLAVLYVWQDRHDITAASTKPTIAVLPLGSAGSDEATRRLANGLTDDIVTDLTHFADLYVIAGDSTLAYRDAKVDPRTAGKELGATYVLQGNIQREADQIRISAQLVDVPAGNILWSERWDRPAADVFAVQSEVAERIAGTLGSVESSAAIAANEIRKMKGRPPASLQAYDYYLQAVEARGKFTKQAILDGIAAASKAIELDPNFGRAYGTRARLYFNTINYEADYDTAMKAMETDARRAVELDPSDPEARAALAWYYANRGRNNEAEIELRAAMNSSPANISLLKMAASVMAFNGHPEEAAALADKVLKMDPKASSGTLNTIKDAYFFAKRYDDCVAIISRVPPESRSRGGRLFLAMSYAFLNRAQDAELARTELLVKHPTLSAELLKNQGWTFARPEDEQLLRDGFRAINLPLCASDADLAKISKPVRLAGCPVF